MNLPNPLIWLQLKRAETLKTQSRKMLVVSASIGMGSLCSVIVGSLLKYLTGQNEWFVFGTVLSSIALIPTSILYGLSVFDKIRHKWITSDEIINLLNFFEEEFSREIDNIKKLGLEKLIEQNMLVELCDDYKKKKENLISSKKIISNKELNP